MSVTKQRSREFVRTFFTSPAAVEGDDSAEMARKASQLRGMQAPDVWVPDNEDATAPNMRDEGAENIVEVVAENGTDFPGEIHPRVVWHRDDPETRYRGLQHMLTIADPESGAIEHIDGFVIPEVGDIDDWKKADEFITIVEDQYDLEEGSIAMSVIVESGEAELAMGDLREEVGRPSNNLDERLFMLVDGEVDYTKAMHGMTPTGELPPWPELRHNTSRGAAAADLIAVDGPYDDIRDVEGYRERMAENRAKGQIGIWSLTPGQAEVANKAPLPPKSGHWFVEVDDREVDLHEEDGVQVYDGDRISLEETADGYRLTVGTDTQELDEDELKEELVNLASYVPSLDDIVDSMEEFEAAKEAGKGAIAMTQSTTLRIDGIGVDISRDRMWDEATYQAAQTPISLFQDVYENRPDQHEELDEIYGAELVERAMTIGQ